MMKRVVCLVVSFVLILSSVAYASHAPLIEALGTGVYSAKQKTEYALKLNKPFEFMDEIIDDEFEDYVPIDVQMLAESACSFSETADIAYEISEDYQKIKMSASTQINLPLEFNDDLKAEIWSRTGMWLDADFSDDKNPAMTIIYKVPLSTKYYVIDYSEILRSNDSFSATEMTRYLKEYTSKQKQDELREYFKELILNNVTISETMMNKEYILKADDAGFKAILKGTAEKLFDIISGALEIQEIVVGDDARYEFEQYLAIIDDFTILGDEGMKVKVSLKGNNIHVSDVTISINCNLHDVLSAYGVDMSAFNREKWELDFTITMKNTYENVNQKVDVDIPEITEENSTQMYNADDEYIPVYDTIYLGTSKPVEVDENGNFALPLSEAMEGMYVSKRYYNVDDDKIVITPREGQYDFVRAEMNIGSNVLIVDGKEMKLSLNVTRTEQGDILIPFDAIEKMTGFELKRINVGMSGNTQHSTIVFSRPNPDYVEPDNTDDDYVYSKVYVHDEGFPVIKDDVIYIPLKNTMVSFEISEENITAVDGVISVVKDENNQKVPEFTKIEFRENSCDVYVESNKFTLDAPVIERNGRSYFPVQFLECINCSLSALSFFQEEKPSYSMAIERNIIKKQQEEEMLSRNSYNTLSIWDNGNYVYEDGEYYIPLWPLMGEMKVNGDDIYEDGGDVTVTSQNPESGFSKITIQGNSVVKDGISYTLEYSMIERNGKKYLPAEFVETVFEGQIYSISAYYNNEYTNYVYSVRVPNPLYKEKKVG